MADPITTNIHVHNTVQKVTSNKVLMFLQPVTTQENYLFSAWNVLNPGPGSTQTVPLTTSFKASIAEFASTHGDYSDPVSLPLGQSLTISDLHGQSATITSTVHASLAASQVGLYNDTLSPQTDLSVVWYVNGNKVVETNNTEDSTLNTGFTATFQLKQAVYLMLGQQPGITTTYTAQTFGSMVEIPVPNGATDLYIVVYTGDDGIDTFKAVSQAEFKSLMRQADLAYSQHRRVGALLAENAALGGSAEVGVPTPYGIVNVRVLDPANGAILTNGIGIVTIDNGTVLNLTCMTFLAGSMPVVNKQYVISADRHVAGANSPTVPVTYTLRCTASGPNSTFVP